MRRRWVGSIGLRCSVVLVLVVGLVVAAQFAAAPRSSPARADMTTGSAGLFVPTQGTVLDTRSGLGGVSGPVAANTWYAVPVAGQAGVPTTGVSSVQVSVSVLTPAATGLIKLAPDGTTDVHIAALTYTGGGGSISASSIVALPVDGKIGVLATTSVTVLMHVQGYYTAGNGSLAPGGYVPLSPTRLVDTRYGIGLPQAKLAPGSTTAIQVGGLVGVPTDASAVFVMLTAITTGAAGYFSPYPAGATRPANVSLNYLANSSTIAGAAVDLGTGGQFNLWIGTAGTAIDVIVDVVGYYSATPGAGAAFTPASARVYDSRIAPEVALSASGSRTVPVAGVAGVPAVSAGIGAFAFSAQIVHSGSGVGYLTMAPGDQSSGAVAAVFFSAGSNVRSDLVVVPAGSDGTVTLVNSSPDPINVILDVEGWFSLPPPLVTSLYFLPSQAIPSAVAESAADFQWQPADPGISSYSYSEDGGAAVAVPAAQTALAWYPSATGPHTLSVRGILANGVMTPPAIFSFTVAPPVAPSVPAFLATDLGRVDGDLISGVVDGNGASEITANFYVTDASGNPLGASSSDPYGSAQITAGQRASLLIPAAALTSGATYHWTMEACAAGACSARTADQSFVASAPPSAPTPAATTSVTLAATSGSSAPIGTTACAGAPCQPTVDDRLRVGDQGDGQLWRGYLTFNLSTVPAGARLTSAVLTLGPPTTTAANPVAGVGFVPLANPPAAGATGVVLAGLAEVDGGFSATGTNPSADITSLVQGWLDGDHPNGGLAVQASSETTGAGVSFPSPTASSGQPSLVVQYEAPTIPDPPTALTVRGGNAGLLVTWAAPQQEGSSKGVDHYLVTATAGSSTLQLTTAASYALLGGLTNGASYSVTVQAVNSLGASAGMTASGAPQAVANGSTLLACALSYQQARDQLQAGTANTASAALTGSSCSSSLTTRLSLEAPNLLSLRQLEATEGHPATADGSAQLSDGLALPAADGGVDVWAPLSRSTDETGSTGTPNLSSQLLLHYGPDNSLLSSYAADAAWTPLTAGTSPNGVLTSDQAALADQTNSLPPAIPGVATGTPAVPQGIAQPQYKHTINRTSAANWAIAHYKDPHYNQPDNCTDFISRALHFGGGMAYNYHHQPAYSFYSFPGTFFWFPFGHAISDDNAWFNGTSGNAIKQRWDGRNWTASYNTAADLMTFLSRNPGQWITYFGDARPGDVVFYAWTPLHGKYRTVNHVGIVSWYSAPDWDAEFWTAAQNADYAYRSIWDALASIRNDEQPGTSPAIYIFRPYSSSN